MKEKIKYICKDQEWKTFKLGIAIQIVFYKISPDGVDAWFNGGCMTAITSMDTVDEVIDIKINKFEE